MRKRRKLLATMPRPGARKDSMAGSGGKRGVKAGKKARAKKPELSISYLMGLVQQLLDLGLKLEKSGDWVKVTPGAKCPPKLLMAVGKHSDAVFTLWEKATTRPQAGTEHSEIDDGRSPKGKRSASMPTVPMKKKAKAGRRVRESKAPGGGVGGRGGEGLVVPEDGSVPLENGQQERFCLLMAKGIFSNYSCYMQAYGDDQKGESARSSASRLLTNDNIQRRIEWLRKKAAEGVVYEINDTLKWLVDVIRTPVGYLDDESPLVQEVQRDITGSEEEGVITKVKIKMPSKMDAQKLLVDIKGWKKSDKDGEKQADAVVDLVAWIRNGGNKRAAEVPAGQ